MNKAIKRIINKDLKSIEHYKLNEQGIYIEFNEQNMLEAHAMIIGPKDTLYEGGYLFFNINFPKNYPYSPPDVSYVSRGNVRIHPNLYVKSHKSGFGKVCLSILGTWSGPGWTTIMDISTVLLSIQSLLDNDPLLNEPGFNKKNKHQISIINNYNDVIFFENINSLLVKNYQDIPQNFEIFKDIIYKEFNDNYMNIYNNIQKYKDMETKKITISIYGINYIIRYEELMSNFKNFCNKLNITLE
tara:strand:- start:475 stop:1203 length:729 start_codon:yes stop_codon:yes gene_type:complete